MNSVIFIVVSLFLVGVVDACVIPPKNYYVTVPELIKDSTSIIFAKAVKGETKKNSNVYSFQPIEILKGSSEEKFVVTVSNALFGNTAPMDLHKEYYFWTHAISGNHIDSDCTIRPNFRIGHDYLIFLSDNPSLRSYEEILSRNDRFLTYVRESLNPKREPSAVLSDSEFIDQFNLIAVYRCPSKVTDDRGRPRLLKSVKGDPPKKSPWPQLANKTCSGSGQDFLYLSAGDKKPVLTVPVEDGVADISSVTGGVELIRFNKLNVSEL